MRLLPSRRSQHSLREAKTAPAVSELVDELIADDLNRMEGRLERNLVLVGMHPDGTEVRIPPYGRNLLSAAHQGLANRP
jgi:hypothetical protein